MTPHTTEARMRPPTMRPPEKIGTTRFGCGCTVHTELDVNGMAPWLEHCPTHAQATAMLGLARAVAGLYMPDDDNRNDPSRGLAKEARAILRAVEKG